MKEMKSTGRDPGFADKGACSKCMFIVVEEIDDDIDDFWTNTSCSTIGI
jgi:hypothetical protein